MVNPSRAPAAAGAILVTGLLAGCGPASVVVPSTTTTTVPTTTVGTTAVETTGSTPPIGSSPVVFERTHGGEAMDRGVSFVQTADRGFAVVGVTTSLGAGGEDVLLVRLDGDGHERWSRTYGGPDDDAGWGLVQTEDGGFVVAGFTSSFGAGGVDVYLLRVDADGAVVWERTHGGAGDDYGWGILPTADGFAVVGETDSLGAGDIDGYLLAVDDTGDELWSHTYGGVREDRTFAVDVTSDGGFVIAGVTRSSGAGGRDAYAVRTDPDGAVVWERTFGDTGDDVAHAVDVIDDGGVFLVGYTDGFGAHNYDAHLVELDDAGDTRWEQTFGGGGEDRVISGEQTSDGGFIVAGYTQSSGAGNRDAYVVKTDSDGVVVWERTFGGRADDIGYTIRQIDDGGYVLVGHLSDGGESTWDALVVRLEAD